MEESFVVTVRRGGHERTVVLLNVHPLASLVEAVDDAIPANWDRLNNEIIDVRRIDLIINR